MDKTAGLHKKKAFQLILLFGLGSLFSYVTLDGFGNMDTDDTE